MRKFMLACVVFILLAGVHSFTPATAGSDNGILIAQADAKAPADAAKKEEPKKEEPKKDEAPKGGEAPEKIKFENVGKLGIVEFNHKLHGEKNKCDDCHAADKPLFEKKISKVGFKMADMYTGKSCGFCHDGKDKHPFEAKKSCAKCHAKK